MPPSPAVVVTKLTCRSQSAKGDPLALMIKTSATESELLVVDMVDAIHPVVLCALSPASGGRFISATRIAFWAGRNLGVGDIAAGLVAATATLPTVPTDGAFSPDGSVFAYRVGGDINGLSTHLFIAGQDRTLVVRSGIGDHGGSWIGPATQLKFSADGEYLLSIDSLFANFEAGPPNFLVYDLNGSMVFQSATAAFGAWARQGNKLYFLAQPQHGDIRGDVHSWDPVAGELRVAQGLSSYFWPALAPDDRRLVFNSYNSAGLPHLWKVDVGAGVKAQLSTGISTHPVFVGHNAIWSNEEKPCDCGLGLMSAPDGNIVVHNLQTGQDTTISLLDFGPDGVMTSNILDTSLN
jgi:hypothetical protein